MPARPWIDGRHAAAQAAREAVAHSVAWGPPWDITVYLEDRFGAMQEDEMEGR